MTDSHADRPTVAANHHYDLLIVGAGLVGGALACALACGEHSQHLRIGVIEAGSDPQPFNPQQFDPRVVALTHASQALLDSFGAWQLIAAERLCPYSHMTVWDGEGTGQIEFDSLEVGQSSLGHIVENSVATRAIMQRLASLPQITLIHARVDALLRDEASGTTQVILTDGVDAPATLSAPLLLACDGANSRIRELANMRTREWNYDHHAIVTTVRTERPHQFTAWQRFMPAGPLAFLPLLDVAGNSNPCSIVWSQLPELATRRMALSDADFALELGDALEQRLGRVLEVDKRYCLPLRQRHAVDYILPGLALVGDAAHTIHPLAGQGVNLGFLDVAALRDEIDRACARAIPLHDMSILRRYQRARKSDNLAMMATMEGFKRLFSADPLPLRWLRNEGLRQLDKLGPLKNRIVRQAMGL